MAWIDDEDNLVKAKLAGMSVTDSSAPVGGREAKVWFRFPEQELREADYPFLTIDLINISEAADRAQRGGQMRPTVTGYRPPGFAVSGPGRIAVTEWPVAMNLDYQVTTWARTQQHDRALLQQVWAKFPGRYGSVGGNAAPYVRPISAQLMGMVVGDRLDEYGKRLFKKIFTLRVFSELWASEVKEITGVTGIEISLPVDISPGDWLSDINCYEG